MPTPAPRCFGIWKEESGSDMKRNGHPGRVTGIDAYITDVHAEAVRVEDFDRTQIFFQRLAEKYFHLHRGNIQHCIRGGCGTHQQGMSICRGSCPGARQKKKEPKGSPCLTPVCETAISIPDDEVSDEGPPYDHRKYESSLGQCCSNAR